jgi:branched-chain amino acid aminotransferase group I
MPRDEAKVSVFDSSVQGGDAVWEGLRVYGGRIFQLDAHLDRLFDSAKAMAFVGVPTRATVKEAIFATLRANGMRDGVHIRLTLTRGKKVTSGMSPRLNQYGTCLIVLAEWKAPVYDREGIRLITSSIRRNSPQCIDSKIHHNNLINNILAKIEANVAGVDDAIMLDLHGYVSETNATNLFFVKRGVLLTPHADSCLPGITRGVVMQLARSNEIPLVERNLSLAEVYTADELFTTGTMGELAPVLEVDGRVIGSGAVGPMTRRLQTLYSEQTACSGEPLPF